MEENVVKVPKDAVLQIARLEERLARVREEYDKLKVASARRNAREAKVASVVRNLSVLEDLLGELGTKLPQAQLVLLDVANGHLPDPKTLFGAAETLGKLAQRSRRMASELTSAASGQ